MSLAIGGRTGESNVGEGAVDVPLRQGNDAALLFSQSHGHRYETGGRGNLFEAASSISTGVTVASDSAYTGWAASGTSNAIFVLLNPYNSGVNGSVLRTTLFHKSGTPGAGGVWSYIVSPISNLNAGQTQNNNSTAGRTTVVSNAGGQGGKLQAYFLAALGLFTPTILRPLGTPFAGTAIAATNQNLWFFDQCNGDIVIPPGRMLIIAPAATGTSHIVHVGCVWEEVTI